jgi:hypothetical protein
LRSNKHKEAWASAQARCFPTIDQLIIFFILAPTPAWIVVNRAKVHSIKDDGTSVGMGGIDRQDGEEGEAASVLAG